MKDGGAAFPHRITIVSQHGGAEHQEHLVHDGMSLRDWFAGMALQGISRPDGWGFNQPHQAKLYSKRAYLLADAMLESRK